MNYYTFRKKHGLTQAKAGALLGMTDGVWWTIEQGKKVFAQGEETAIKRILASFEAGEWEKVNTEPVTPESLKDFRNSLNLSNAQLAEIIGCSASHVSKLISGALKINQRYQLNFNSFLWEASHKRQEVKTEILAPEMNEQRSGLINFPYQTTPVRYRDVNSEPWWVLLDVCKAIGYNSVQNANKLVWGDDKQKLLIVDSLGRNQETWFVNESGLYSFLMRCQSDNAQTFARWVTKEVLPSIRKTGQYSVTQAPKSELDIIQAMLDSMRANEKRLLAVESGIAQVQTQLERLPQIDPQKAATDVLNHLAGLNERKARLHELVNSIVNQAKALPQDDPEAQYYSKYQNTWRAVHRHARPLVSAKSDYTSLDQIAHSIDGAELILIRLGGRVPVEQLSLAGVA